MTVPLVYAGPAHPGAHPTAAGGGRSVGGAGAIGRGPAVGDGTDAARRTVPHRALQRALNGCRDVSNKSWMVVPSAR